MALTDADNAKFMEDYDAQDGVAKTDSGLRYKVVKSGPDGGRKPTARSNVTVHYRGTFIDGREFDSSYKRNSPATFGLHQVIPGWTEGVQLMKEGDTFEFAIPYQLAYGEYGGGSIPGRQNLVFTVELLKVA